MPRITVIIAICAMFLFVPAAKAARVLGQAQILMPHAASGTLSM